MVPILLFKYDISGIYFYSNFLYKIVYPYCRLKCLYSEN